MSIATQIARLQNIKASIRSALVTQGIAASNHNMADFANDILQIQTGSIGTDVSDTTATRDTVVSPKVFYDANGQRQTGQLIINDLTPSSSGQLISTGGTYKASTYGYAIKEYSVWTPESSTHLKAPGFVKLSDYGYIYAEEQMGGGTVKILDADSRNATAAEEKTVSVTITKDQVVPIIYIRRGTLSSCIMDMTINRDGISTTKNYTPLTTTTSEVYTDTVQLYAGDIVTLHTKGTGTTGTASAKITMAYLE